MKGLAELRKAKGLTQQELANLAAVSRVSVARYETTDRMPNGKVVARLARALGVSTSRLLGA